MTTTPGSDTFDELTAAVGRFLAEIAETARLEQPAAHATWEALLQSGECSTNVSIKLLPGGIQVRATLNTISDGAELLILDEVDGLARPVQ